jgi:hypothetical protein
LQLTIVSSDPLERRASDSRTITERQSELMLEGRWKFQSFSERGKVFACHRAELRQD